MTVNIYKNEITEKINKAVKYCLITIEEKENHLVIFGAENVLCSITEIK